MNNSISNVLLDRITPPVDKADIKSNPKADKTNTVSFSDIVGEFINTVNDTQITSGKNVADVVSGKSDNIAEAMVSMQEGRINFQLMLEIRNKLLESYQEIQRLQV